MMQVLFAAAFVWILGSTSGQVQATTPGDLPSWAVFPDVVGEFKTDRSRDLREFGILARYKRGAATSDVYLYRIPQVLGDHGSLVSLNDEAALTQETLLRLRGRGYDRVKLVEASLPLHEMVGEERIEGIMVGAMLIVDGQQASTYTTLFNIRGYRLKIRTTIRDPKPDTNGTMTFVRTLLRVVLRGGQAR
jgi:hypothetical protein